MRRNDREFINTRTRFQRLSDSSFFTGWVEDLSRPHFEVRSSLDSYEIGERFLFELYGQKANQIFIAELESVDGMNALQKTAMGKGQDATPIDITFEFSIVSESKFIEPKEPARKAVQSLTAFLAKAGESLEVSISDISESGVGLLTNSAYEVGEPVILTMTAMMRTITLDCQVRHCRPDKQIKGMFRTGLQFENMNRVDLVAWAKVMDAA